MDDLDRCTHCGRQGTLTSLSAGNRCVVEPCDPMSERQWCIVPGCDEEVVVHQKVTLITAITGSHMPVPVMVPFCRAHGLTVGSDV